MSIVLDALKRAEREHHVSLSNAPFDQRNVSRKLLESKAFYKKILGVLVLLNIVGILAFYVWHQNNQELLSKNPLQPITEGTVIPIPPTSPLVATVPTLSTLPGSESPAIAGKVLGKQEMKKERNHIYIPDGPEIKIDGVFIDKKGAFVLFGDEMLGVGEDLFGTTIKTITLNKVTLEYKGHPYEILA